MMGDPASCEIVDFRSEADNSEEEESGVGKYIQVPGEGQGQNRLAALLDTWRGPGACMAEVVHSIHYTACTVGVFHAWLHLIRAAIPYG
jgi:hypothetical protein